jgi:cyclase
MLKVRIIPTLLCRDNGLVKGEKFNSSRRVGAILPAIKVYNNRQVDELVVLDVEAWKHNSKLDVSWVEDFSSECFVPLAVGGGIRALEDIRSLLAAGADKVVINSGAYENPQLIKQASQKFGSQCIVLAIDVKKNEVGEYICYSNCGSVNTGFKVHEWIEVIKNLGVGEILITSIDLDGTLVGVDIELARLVAQLVSIPVIYSGGVSSALDVFNLISKAGIAAVAASSIFLFTEQTPLEVKQYLKEKGIAIRLC